jgi:hypothetical protein
MRLCCLWNTRTKTCRCYAHRGSEKSGRFPPMRSAAARNNIIHVSSIKSRVGYGIKWAASFHGELMLNVCCDLSNAVRSWQICLKLCQVHNSKLAQNCFSTSFKIVSHLIARNKYELLAAEIAAAWVCQYCALLGKLGRAIAGTVRCPHNPNLCRFCNRHGNLGKRRVRHHKHITLCHCVCIVCIRCYTRLQLPRFPLLEYFGGRIIQRDTSARTNQRAVQENGHVFNRKRSIKCWRSVRGASVKSQMCAVSHEKPGCFHSCFKMPSCSWPAASPAIVPPTPPCECAHSNNDFASRLARRYSCHALVSSSCALLRIRPVLHGAQELLSQRTQGSIPNAYN